METMTLPGKLRLDHRKEPFVLQDSPFVSQFFLGFMSKGLDWSTPTLLFIERWGCQERASLPDMDGGWVVRAEPAGNDGLTNSMYLNPDAAVWSGEEAFDFNRVWKYKSAKRVATLNCALLLVNWALNLLPESAYVEAPVKTATAPATGE